MRQRPWHAWGKWALFGVMSAAIVMAAASGNEGGDATATREMRQRGERLWLVEQASFRPQQRPAAGAHIEFERLDNQKSRTGDSAAIGNVFNATSWYTPPPRPKPQPVVVLPPPPPPKPTAPPIPFTYFGRYEDMSAAVVVLVRGGRIYTVSEGDVIDGTYRVERIAGGMLELTYLPLNIKQSISMGGPS